MSAHPFSPRVLSDLPARSYHSATGVSHSMLKLMDPTPAHFKAAMAEPFETTPAMIMGTLTHAMVLEPDKPMPRVVVPPDTYLAPADCSLVKTKKVSAGDMIAWNGNSNWCKDWMKQQKKDGNIIVTSKDRASVVGMVNAITVHPVASEIIRTAATEVSLFARNPKFYDLFGEDNPMLKCRLDIAPVGNFLADVKTCEDAGDDFRKTMFTYGYYQQAAFYLDLWNLLHPQDIKSHFIFIAVEKDPPYAVRLVRLGQKSIMAGRGTYLQRLTQYVECTRSGQWPGYSTEIDEEDIPDWALASLERKAA